MPDKIKTQPSSEPVTAAELKTWLRNPADDDAVFDEMIKAAREFFEQQTGMAVMDQTRVFTLDAWPLNPERGRGQGDIEAPISIAAAPSIEIPTGPLIEVLSIKTYSAGNVATTFASTNYFVDTQSDIGRIAVNSGGVWPSPARPINGIEIEYRAGFETPTDVDGSIKIGIKQLAAHYYENREAIGEMTLSQAPLGMRNIVRRYKLNWNI